MLSTLSICLMAFSVVKKRGMRGHLRPERTGLKRDLDFFLGAFTIAIAALFVPQEYRLAHTTLALLLLFLYFIYVMLTVRASTQLVRDGHGTEAHAAMFLCRIGLPEHYATIIAQLAIGLALLVLGAKGFIHGVEQASHHLGVSALFLSLLIVPVATELPEKVNSILWARRGKDTLAFGNITGGTVLPAIGLLLTPWLPRKEVLFGIVFALAAALWLRFLAVRGILQVRHLFINGALYVAYIVLMVV